MVSAITLNNVDEAIGIAQAAKDPKVPCVISFSVETNGKLKDGHSLQQAIEKVDDATDSSAAYFMINCAHLSHFDFALEDELWMQRIGGLRANASPKSHSQLNNSELLEAGNPADLASRHRVIAQRFKHLKVFGGCCGTDHTHVAALHDAIAAS